MGDCHITPGPRWKQQITSASLKLGNTALLARWPGPSRELCGSPDFDGEMPLKCLLMSFQTTDTGLQSVKMSNFDVIILQTTVIWGKLKSSRI